jgi:hypothetical protein
MDSFNFLSVLFSVVVGLALTDVLQGFRKLIQARARLTVYWPALAWGMVMILILAQAWWGMFAMRAIAHWTFAMYGTVVAQITLMYLAAGVTMPEVPEHPLDMRAAYFANKGWFFGLLSATVVATFIKDLVLTGHMNSPGNVAFLLIYLSFSLVGAVTKANWYHLALAPLGGLGVLASAVLMSFRL